jgi:TldD protein
MILPRRAAAALDPHRPIRDGFGAVYSPLDFDPAAVAAQALDVARTAGASFADVRVDHRVTQSLGIRNLNGGNVTYGDNVGIGIRVIADGQWGFASTDTVTPDAVAQAARRAVRQAQVNAKGRRTPVALVPVPVVSDGKWAAPVAVDPFGVPLGEQQEALLAGTKGALAVGNEVTDVSVGIAFLRVDRVFACSEGSRIAQTFSFAFPNAVVYATAVGAEETAGAGPAGFDWATAGYETLRDAKLADTMRAAAEEAIRESRGTIGAVAPRSVDVGRYELVVSPSMMWGLVNGTIMSAVGMERALGKRTGLEGTTYAAPPAAVLGKLELGAPHLTVRADRSTPGGLMTVGWDDEGVKPDDFALVEQGVLVDYLALRENVPALGAWYGSRGVPPHSHGVAATGTWDDPGEVAPNMTVAPGTEAITVEDMIRDVKHGIYFAGGGGAAADFGMLNAYGSGSGAQEIRNGKLVGHLTDVAIQFQTQAFWKGLVAVGGPSTVTSFGTGNASLFGCQTVRSVPARFRAVNVVNTGRTR